MKIFDKRGSCLVFDPSVDVVFVLVSIACVPMFWASVDVQEHITCMHGSAFAFHSATKISARMHASKTPLPCTVERLSNRVKACIYMFNLQQH